MVGDDGTIVEILTGKMEHHISADIAYAVWQYWRATGDDEFFLGAGAEILLGDSPVLGVPCHCGAGW